MAYLVTLLTIEYPVVVFSFGRVISEPASVARVVLDIGHENQPRLLRFLLAFSIAFLRCAGVSVSGKASGGQR